jgi:hypothetical protein
MPNSSMAQIFSSTMHSTPPRSTHQRSAGAIAQLNTLSSLLSMPR